MLERALYETQCLLLVLVVGAGFAGCASGNVLRSVHALNPGSELGLAPATGERPAVGQGQVLIRYLRAGGVYFEWQSQALMTAPFASNYPLLGSAQLTRYRVRSHKTRRSGHTLLTQRVAPDRAAIDYVLAGGMRLGNLKSLLLGHSHYDHLADVPDMMRRHLPDATLYANRSAAHMLAAEPGVSHRVSVLQGSPRFLPESAADRDLIRFMAIPSGHAPNLRLFGSTLSWAPGDVEKPWTTPLSEHQLSELKVGQTYAFLIDFLAGDGSKRVVFRVHYQDAASVPPEGYPPTSVLEERPVDLEIVTMPGREALSPAVDRYPTGILKHNRARHALVIHYEDFFDPVLVEGRPNGIQLIDTLRGRTASEFLDAITRAIPAALPDVRPQVREALRAERFTVPLPGAWLLFDTELAE